MNKNIVACIAQTFRTHCVELLLDACDILKAKNYVSIDTEEENISAFLCIFMKENPRSAENHIIVQSEYNYTNETFLLTHKAKQAPRIDLMFETWTKTSNITFAVEAKILTENNCLKTSTKTPLNSKSLQKKYIKNGMDRFITNKYPYNGCMLGYVLEGSIPQIVEGINSNLQKDGRTTETLNLNELNPPTSAVASSTHPQQTGALNLEHYFYKFC